MNEHIKCGTKFTFRWSDNGPIVDVKIGQASLIKINSNTILNYIRERLSSNRVSKIIIYI